MLQGSNLEVAAILEGVHLFYLSPSCHDGLEPRLYTGQVTNLLLV